MTFQERCWRWAHECFGAKIAESREERALRFIEEALELVQASGVSVSQAYDMVDYVYGRKVGELQQEVGGTMVCLAALCAASGIDMEIAADVELTRCWSEIVKIRGKHLAKDQGVKAKIDG